VAGMSESDKPTNPTDPRVALETMWALAPKYAQAKANRVYMEEFRKSLKAIDAVFGCICNRRART
jgi:hypothetical protein